ncbi:surface antigen BspA-like [Trichomonas vaginalis G3]|uniref:Surface antigen BspA-like n=1 Tax=Trichomonas vaginalis (strain ATCC PRA-98 / G3) TaxID=412133 RepID=A2EN97_TRIV3|nr:otolith morphogenesis protein family [Trichomonas vaginalis G3]EAY05856.1 surface antigen BspA-like [Trichomonas vaginalis G3]KAI5531628.1 otolith morphogenesis protein family [Trichomonas vaginalis G3]|eukprot:XP_001318079.1 surface antigen BspA-like [Trichomonas vaginalis G3]
MTNIIEIILPSELIEIGEFSFSSTSLSTIEFPRNLISIDPGAFSNCTLLRDVKIYETHLKIISKQLFMNTISLKNICIPETVEIIEKESFKFSSIENIVFPRNLQSIEDSAFFNCTKLTSISFNRTNITFIGDFSFKNCINLYKVNFSNHLRFLGQESFCNTNIRNLEFIGLRNVSSGTFMNNEHLSFCDFSQTSVEVFSTNLFKNCPNLSSIYYPHNLTYIEKSCFERTGFRYTILPSTVMRVKSMAFSFCPNLIYVELKNTKMKTIPKMMFFKCPLFDRINFPQNLTSIKEFSFSFTNMHNLTFPDSLQIIRNGLIDVHNLSIVNLSNTQIFCFESRMFMNCFCLDTIYLPPYLEEIQEYVFDGTRIKRLVVPFGCKLLPFVFSNSSLETIDLSHSNLTEILPNVFSDTLHLKNVIFPESLVVCCENAFNTSNIPELVFNGLQTLESNSLFCPLLEKIDFSKTNLKILPSFIFSKCPVLKEIILSETLQSIGSNSFHGTQLKEIICPRSLVDIEEEGFMNAIYLETLDLSLCHISTLQPRAFYNCMKLTEIKWPHHLETIQKSCFANSGLKNVTFPHTVTSIGESTFYQCLFLEKVDFGFCQITFIPKNCFFNCKSLKTVIFSHLKYKLTNHAFSTTSIRALTMPELEFDSGLFIQRCRTIEILDLSKTKIICFGKHFFSDCVKLRVLILPPTAEYFSVSAFSNCVSLEKIFYCGRITFSDDIEIPSNSEIEFYVSDIYPNSQIFGISVIRTTKCSEFNVSNIE